MKENNFRTSKQLEIIKAFIYKSITGNIYLHIEIYDKKGKVMFIGNIDKSNWTLKEIRKQHKLK